MDNKSVIKAIEHYQRSIDKCGGDDARMIHCINKLYALPVTVSHLQETRVGRTVNSLRKYEGRVGHEARALVAKWKEMVAAEDSTGSEPEENSQDSEQDIPDTEETDAYTKYSDDRRTSNKSRDKRSDESEDGAKLHKQRHSENRKRKNEDETDTIRKKHKEDKSRHDRKENERTGDDAKHKKSLEHVSKRDKHCDIVGNSHKSADGVSKSSSDNKEYKNEHKKNDNKGEKEYKISNEKELIYKHYNENVENKNSFKSEKKHKSSKSSSSDENKKSTLDKTKYDSESRKKSHRENDSTHRKTSSDRKKDEKKHKKNKKSRDSYDDDEENRTVVIKTQSDNRMSKHNKKKSKKADDDDDDVEGINSASGASFAEALGMMVPDKLPSPARKKGNGVNGTPSRPSTKTSKNPEKSSSSTEIKVPKPVDLLSPNVKLPAIPTDLDIDVNLPVISPNYKPLPTSINPLSSLYRGVSQEEALTSVMSHKNLRTKVYSGNKSAWATVPSLFDMCIRILQENIDALEYTGGVPFSILQPVLERATPDQLSNLEYFNPNLLEDTDGLWEHHCKREFRGKIRQELETWREAYMRFLIEREEKLKALTANIKQSTIDKLTPLRQTKLAYVDSVVKPPRSIARKQAKWGTACNPKPIATPASRVAALNAVVGATGVNNIIVPNPVKPIPSTSSSKPKKAPLMAKTLSLLKNTSRYRR